AARLGGRCPPPGPSRAAHPRPAGDGAARRPGAANPRRDAGEAVVRRPGTTENGWQLTAEDRLDEPVFAVDLTELQRRRDAEFGLALHRLPAPPASCAPCRAA